MKTDKPENTKQATEKQATQPTFADAVTATAQQADTPPPVVVETAEEQQDWKKPDEEAETVREAQRRADDDARREAQRQRLIADYGLTDTEYKVLLATTCKDAPREIAGWFVLFCKHRRLDPFSKQVYLWNDKYEDRNTPNGPVKVPVGQWQVVTGIDGLRVIASRSPYYRGQLRPVWTYEPDPEQRDGIARFVKADSHYGKIAGKRRVEQCEVVVRRAIPQAPADSSLYLEFAGIARFDEFVKLNRDNKIFGNWEVQPEHQIRIRSEAMGLRMAFPEEVGGIYLQEELADRADAPTSDGPPAVALPAADPRDDEIDRLRRVLGWTAAKVRLEGDKYGGGKDGTLEMLEKAVAEKAGAAPKGGPRGAEAAAEPPAPAEEPSLDGAACFWVEEGETCKDPPTHFEFDVATDVRQKVPTCNYHTGAGFGPNGERIVALALCRACGAKRGDEHAVGCPGDETNEEGPGA